MNFTKNEGKHTCCGADRPRKEISTVYKGKKLYFCDSPCLKEFKKNPKRFLESTHLRIDFEELEEA